MTCCICKPYCSEFSNFFKNLCFTLYCSNAVKVCGTFNSHFIANCPQYVPVKEF